jgi:hypothetical protein
MCQSVAWEGVSETEEHGGELALECEIVAGKTPANIVRVPMVSVWQDAPHDRIIQTVYCQLSSRGQS